MWGRIHGPRPAAERRAAASGGRASSSGVAEAEGRARPRAHRSGAALLRRWCAHRRRRRPRPGRRPRPMFEARRCCSRRSRWPRPALRRPRPGAMANRRRPAAPDRRPGDGGAAGRSARPPARGRVQSRSRTRTGPSARPRGRWVDGAPADGLGRGARARRRDRRPDRRRARGPPARPGGRRGHGPDRGSDRRARRPPESAFRSADPELAAARPMRSRSCIVGVPGVAAAGPAREGRLEPEIARLGASISGDREGAGGVADERRRDRGAAARAGAARSDRQSSSSGAASVPGSKRAGAASRRSRPVRRAITAVLLGLPRLEELAGARCRARAPDRRAGADEAIAGPAAPEPAGRARSPRGRNAARARADHRPARPGERRCIRSRERRSTAQIETLREQLAEDQHSWRGRTLERQLEADRELLQSYRDQRAARAASAGAGAGARGRARRRSCPQEPNVPARRAQLWHRPWRAGCSWAGSRARAAASASRRAGAG